MRGLLLPWSSFIKTAWRLYLLPGWRCQSSSDMWRCLAPSHQLSPIVLIYTSIVQLMIVMATMATMASVCGPFPQPGHICHRVFTKINIVRAPPRPGPRSWFIIQMSPHNLDIKWLSLAASSFLPIRTQTKIFSWWATGFWGRGTVDFSIVTQA